MYLCLCLCLNIRHALMGSRGLCIMMAVITKRATITYTPASTHTQTPTYYIHSHTIETVVTTRSAAATAHEEVPACLSGASSFVLGHTRAKWLLSYGIKQFQRQHHNRLDGRTEWNRMESMKTRRDSHAVAMTPLVLPNTQTDKLCRSLFLSLDMLFT